MAVGSSHQVTSSQVQEGRLPDPPRGVTVQAVTQAAIVTRQPASA